MGHPLILQNQVKRLLACLAGRPRTGRGFSLICCIGLAGHPTPFEKEQLMCFMAHSRYKTHQLLFFFMSHPSFWQSEQMPFSGGCAALFSEEKAEIASSETAGNLSLFFCLLGEGRLAKLQKSEG